MILFQKKVVPINPKVGQSDVDAYLSEVREAIAEKRCTFHSNKTKNRETLSGLGLTLSDVYEEISTLTYEDYCYGPVPDNRPNYADESIWVFKKKVDWLMIYIKLEIVSCNGKRLVVLSFHEDNAQ